MLTLKEIANSGTRILIRIVCQRKKSVAYGRHPGMTYFR